MAAPAPVHVPPDGDYTYRKLVERVVDGDPDAWQEFVKRFSNLLFSLLWRYANDSQDVCADLYLYVIEGLHQTSEAGETFYRLRRYLASVDQYQGKGRLTTWLGRVTQNLVSDHFREQEGRKTLPRAIQRLELNSQITFKLLYWDCLSEREAYETLRSKTGQLDRDEFDRMVVEINTSLKSCNRWSIYSEVIRKTPALPLHPDASSRSEGTTEVQVADPAPEASPKASASLREQKGTAQAMGRTLRRVISELPDDLRLLLVSRFKHGMTAGKIAKLLRRKDEKVVYTELERLKNHIKQQLKESGYTWESIVDGLDAIDGLMDEFDQVDPPRKKT